MSLRIVEISALVKASGKIKEFSERNETIDYWQANRKSWLYRGDGKCLTSCILVNV